jgi:hypothetical protein
MSRKRVLIVLGLATVALDAVVIALDHWISKTGGPGILGLELAGSRAHAQRIMGEWGADGRAAARLSLWIDYAFLLCYGAFFTLAGLTVRDWSRAQGRRWMAALGVFVPWFAAAAAVFDACEDALLLLVLAGRGGEAVPVMATVFAGLKFALIATAIAYALLGTLLWVRSRARGRESVPARARK